VPIDVTSIRDWTAADWAAIAACGQLFVLVVAVIVARRQLGEARTLRIEEHRPRVVIDFELTEPPFIFLSITNLGTMAARDVRFSFDQPIATTLDKRRVDDGPQFAELPIFRDGIPTLPPGKTIRTFFDQFVDRVNADLPTRYVAKVHYSAPVPTYPAFDDEYVLDLEIYHHLAYSKEPSLKDVAKQLEQIAKTIAKWTSSHGGLKALSLGDERKLTEELHERHRQRQAKSPKSGDHLDG
jgi:hypothetical protein